MNKKLQVFVSSTYTDLIDERQAAVEAILDAGHIPAGMELFKAGKSQMKTIQKWIDESDVYMLILGGRYGSIEKESGLSYTELEYRYALSKNMPVFSIILSDSFLFTKAASMGKDKIFEKDNINKYECFKNFVETNIVKYASNTDKIESNIHSQLNSLLTDNDYNLLGWVHNNPIGFLIENNVDISINGEYVLFYYSYSKYNNNLVKSILEIDKTGQVCFKNNVNGKLSPMPEFIYNGICTNENDILYFFLSNNNSKEKSILQLIKSVGNLNRFIGLFSALTSSGIPVCVKVACFKNDENFTKINYETLQKCLSSKNIVNSETSYIVEDDIKNLFFSDYIFL